MTILGYAQHDAQEFLSFLLDGLHEDLNRARQKREDKLPLDHNAQDIHPSDMSWGKHKLRNNSIVVDLFHGQY